MHNRAHLNRCADERTASHIIIEKERREEGRTKKWPGIYTPGRHETGLENFPGFSEKVGRAKGSSTPLKTGACSTEACPGESSLEVNHDTICNLVRMIKMERRHCRRQLQEGTRR